MSSEGDHRGGFGFREDVTEAILVRDLSVSAAWCGNESDADPGDGDQVGDALRAGTDAICGNERTPACGRASGAPERRGTNIQENLGNNPDVVRRNERGAGICGFSIWMQDKSGIYEFPGLREYSAYLAVCVCYVDLDSEKKHVEDTNGSSQSRAGADKIETSHALRGFYELADILIVLDEVLCLEVSNLPRQLKFNPEIMDIHPIIGHLTDSLWFRSMDLTIASSTSKARGPSNERKNVAAAEKQLESMGYHL